MSFLLLPDGEDDDPRMTLEAALAFIDACDTTAAPAPERRGATDTPSATGSSASDGLRSTDDDDDDDVTSATPPARTRAKSSSAAPKAPSSAASCATSSSSNSSAVARCRERKKLEVRRLHEEAAELEAQLAHLRGRAASVSASTGGPAHTPPQRASRSERPSRADDDAATTRLLWMDLAAMQARERYKSEALNQRLRAALEKQRKMGDSLEALLWGVSERKKQRFSKTLMGFELLSEAQKRTVYTDSLESVQSRTLQRMRATVAQMHCAFASVFDADEMGRVDSATQSTSVKPGLPGSGGGSFVELRSSTPLRCGCHDGGEMIWRFIASSSAQKTGDYVVKKLQVTDSTYEKNYTVYLNRLGETVELHGISFLQRFQEADGEVYVWSSTLATSTGGPTFFEKGWIAVTKSTSENPLFPSVQHTCHQIFSDDPGAATRLNQRSSSSPTSAEQEVRDFILTELVSKTRGKYQIIQSFLIDIFMKFSEHPVIQVPTPKLLTC